jgi:hypothetical protein
LSASSVRPPDGPFVNAARARSEPKLRFTPLAHHITRERGWTNLCQIPKRSAPGVGGQTVTNAKETFGEWLEPVLRSVHRQGYRAPDRKDRASLSLGSGQLHIVSVFSHVDILPLRGSRQDVRFDPRRQYHKGVIPDTLPQVKSDRICYLSIDRKNAAQR